MQKNSISSFLKRAQEKKAKLADVQSRESILINHYAEKGINLVIKPGDSNFDIYNRAYGVDDYWSMPIFDEARSNITKYLNNLTRKIDISDVKEEVILPEDIEIE